MENLKSRARVAAVFTVLYFLIFYVLVGWRPLHTYLLILVLSLALAHRYTMYALLAWSGFLGWTLLYDAMSIMPNHEVNSVHIKDLYDLEVLLFGIYESGTKISLCEWVVSRYNAFLSFILGFSYLLWMPAPMLYAFYLIFAKKSAISYFSVAYFLTNVIGVLFYYLIPAAPPWYYLNHGPEVDLLVPGSAAGLAEFDKIIGLDIFQGIYSNNSNIFGAIPSLHAAYPLLCLFIARKFQHRGWMFFFGAMSIGTWIAAVYTQHHYVIDVLCGVICAFMALYLMRYLSTLSGWKKVDDWYRGFLFIPSEVKA